VQKLREPTRRAGAFARTDLRDEFTDGVASWWSCGVLKAFSSWNQAAELQVSWRLQSAMSH